MKKYLLITCAVIFLSLTAFKFNDYFSKQTFVYDNITKGKNLKVTYTLQKKNGNILIDEMSNIGLTTMKYTEDFKLQELTYKSEEKKCDYTFKLENNSVVGHGLSNGKEFSKQSFKARPTWAQEFNFGLRSFLQSNNREFRFVIINPDDFTSNVLVAYKENIETVKTKTDSYNTQKVKITLPGFKGHFWKAEVWYELESNDLIKYKANEGPNTPTTVTTMVSKK